MSAYNGIHHHAVEPINVRQHIQAACEHHCCLAYIRLFVNNIGTFILMEYCEVWGAIPKSLITEWPDVVGSTTFAVLSLYC